METKRGNIVLMPVISRRGSGKEAAMTKEQFEREKKYQAALAVPGQYNRGEKIF